jgi:hypothetical protein
MGTAADFAAVETALACELWKYGGQGTYSVGRNSEAYGAAGAARWIMLR